MKTLTIFTPTYNRKDHLVFLYNSLLNQTCKDFKWLIIDDGSNDGTYEYIMNIKAEGKIEIEYKYIENSGKYIAHNIAVQLTKTNLFCCVDSDDRLSKNAVERIKSNWILYQSDNKIIGVIAMKSDFNNNKVTKLNKKVKFSTLKDAYIKYKMKGDAMLIYRSEVIKKEGFPNVENERFFPEAYLYDLLDKRGNMLIIEEYLYQCEYLEGGYSKNMSKVIKNNPTGYLLFLKNRIEFDKSIFQKVLNTIKYSGLCIALNRKYDLHNKLEHRILYSISYLYFLKRYNKV